MEDSVNVAIRVRPSSNVFDQSIAVSVISDKPPVLHVINKQLYSFDHVFPDDVPQEKVYDCMVKPLIDKVLVGYNCTVFAYGQTGTGKTYTIGSHSKTDADAGFIARACDELVRWRSTNDSLTISITYYEIYNEKVFDLLSDKREPIIVKGFKVDGLETIDVCSSEEAANLLVLGNSNRHTGETKQNRFSSRSHAIFTLKCSVSNGPDKTEAKLNLVDLAGSEGVRKTGTEGSQFQEGVNINKGLFCIGRVINALTTNMVHIPYRQSMITTILQDSLSKRNCITLIACISPDVQDMHETIQTLEFAQGTKRLKNKPEVNNIILEYKKNNPTLFERPTPGLTVNVRSTPLKRQNQSVGCGVTPNVFKKPKVNHTWTPSNAIAESEVQTPPTLAAMSVASTLGDGPIGFTTFSPIIQKCTEVVENKIMEKFQILLKAYSYRPSPEKVKTPQFSWQRLHSEVAQIVRDEFTQLTTNRSRICSSPIEKPQHSRESNVAKRLDFDEEDPFVFKVPEKPLPKRRGNKEVIEINESKAPRRSTRLSMKVDQPTFSAQSTRRKSVRLAGKVRTEVSPQPKPQQNELKRPPIPTPRKHSAQSSQDAKTIHCNNILSILNTGSEKELQKLPSVGPKTARQIYTFRQLNGPFAKIEDLSKLEACIGNQYRRFINCNFLS